MQESLVQQTLGIEHSPLGIEHFIAQTDMVGRLVVAVLGIMSVASWTVIVVKCVRLALERWRSRRFIEAFRSSADISSLQARFTTPGAHEPFAELLRQASGAIDRLRAAGSGRVVEPGSASAANAANEFVSRALGQSIADTSTRLESGLTVLASVGSAAPFVGLFGTVWGIYHALLAIGLSGQGTLDKVAGPVGEALIMTAFGLAVAIPAVLAYNAFVRSNRVTIARLDSFAHDVFGRIALGGR